jgi:hypothetical protein
MKGLKFVVAIGLMLLAGLAGCKSEEDVDYRKLIRADGKDLVDDEVNKEDALCSAAKAKSPAVANESNPHCRALRMAGVCLRTGVCP